MEVYHSVFDTSLQTVKPVEALIVDNDAFNEYDNSLKIGIFGNGMEKCREVLSAHNAIHFIDNISCSSKEIGDLAVEKLKEEDFEDLAYYEPFYLKEFIAKPSKKLL